MRVGPAAFAVAILVCGIGCGTNPEETVYPRLDCQATFRYEGKEDTQQVSVIGEFNDWRSEGWELARGESSATFEGTFTIGGGRWAYRFLVDDEEILDPDNPLTVFGRDGREHSALMQTDCTRPGWSVATSGMAGDDYEAELIFYRSLEGPAIDPASVRAVVDGREAAEAEIRPDSGEVKIRYKPSPGKHLLRVNGADQAGQAADELLLPFWAEPEAFDWRDAVIYQIVVDRFRQGGGALDESAGITRRMGGDYAGVVETIESGYLGALGVNALWISPAYVNAAGLWPGFDGREYESYHGYWPVASRAVETRFGGEAGLAALVEAAHAQGLRVILDVVPNHVHIDHPDWNERRREWFTHPEIDCVCGRECSWQSDIEHCWFTDYLPDFDWTKAAVLDHVVPDAIWWLGAFNLDGLRIDAVPMMPRLVTRHLRYRADRSFGQGGEPVFLIGETFTGGQGRPQIRRYLGPQGLSGQFDFPIMWTLRTVVGQGEGEMGDVLDEVKASAASWEGSGAVMGLILGNHDVPRFLSLANGEGDDAFHPPAAPATREPYQRLAVAFAFLLTLPGAPVVYYGDEYGMPGAGDPDNRRPMRFAGEWNDNEAWLYEQASHLGRLRREVSAFRRGAWTELWRHDDATAYFISDQPNSAALVVLSRGRKAIRAEFDVASEIDAGELASWRDCFGGDYVVSDGIFSTTLPPYGMMILTDRIACDETAAN